MNAGGNLVQVRKVQVDEEARQNAGGSSVKSKCCWGYPFECRVRVWLIDQLYDLTDQFVYSFDCVCSVTCSFYSFMSLVSSLL